jgi:hypothetical protein
LRVLGWSIEAEIVGIGVHPEYLLASVDEGFTLPMRGSLAAVMVSEELLYRRLWNRVLVNDLVVTLNPGADRDAAQAGLVAALAGQELREVRPRERVYSVLCHHNRLTSYADLLPTVVAVFDGIALLVLLLAVRRLVAAGRRTTGALLAFGVPTHRVLGAWALAVAALVVVGVAVGAVAAPSLADQVTGQYLRGTGFPLLAAPLRPGPVLQAALLAVGLLPLAMVPVVLQLRVPARALLRPPIAVPRVPRVVRALTAALAGPERLGVRNAMRRPMATAVTVSAVAGTLVMATSIYAMASAQQRTALSFLDARRWDAAVTLWGAPEQDAWTAGPGIEAQEPVTAVSVSLLGAGGEEQRTLVGLPVPSRLQGDGWLLWGRPLAPEAREVLLGYRDLRALDVDVGDDLEVRVGEVTASLQVVGVVNSFDLDRAYVAGPTLDALSQGAAPARVVWLSGSPDAVADLYRDARVQAVVPGRRLDEVGRVAVRGFGRLVFAYGHLGALCALVIAASMLGIAVRERSAELAALRTQGVGAGFLARALVTEAAVIAVLAGLLALPLTRVAVRIFQERIAASDGMWIPVRADLPSLGLVLGGPAAVVVLAAVPAVWAMMRLRLAHALGEGR